METWILLSLFAISVVVDEKVHKIPNWLCGIGIVTGSLLQLCFYGVRELGIATAFGLSMFFILIPLWRFQILGGGDVKLMIMSAFYLKREVFILLVLAGVCTACYSLVLMLVRHNLWARLKFFGEYLRMCLLDGILVRYPFDKEKEEDRREAGVPVTCGILAGFLVGKLMGMF